MCGSVPTLDSLFTFREFILAKKTSCEKSASHSQIIVTCYDLEAQKFAQSQQHYFINGLSAFSLKNYIMFMYGWTTLNEKNQQTNKNTNIIKMGLLKQKVQNRTHSEMPFKCCLCLYKLQYDIKLIFFRQNMIKARLHLITVLMTTVSRYQPCYTVKVENVKIQSEIYIF